MVQDTCDNCGGPYYWNWEEAFSKFGFNDGDGQVETYQVETALTNAGYEVVVDGWGLHNTVITSIKRGKTEYISQENISFGYDCPRAYLPKIITALLDKEFPSTD